MRVRSETRTWEQWRAAYFASVSPSVRKRGREYFESGAVDLSKAGPEHVEATVTGSRLYAVELDARSGKLAARCTCPYFDEYFEWCKHIWATLLAANEAKPDEVDLDEIEDEIAVQGRDAAGPRPAPDWKDQVARIRGASAGDLGEAWPPEREIAYVVDLPATLEGRGLILEVAQRQRKASGEWTRLKAQKIPAQRIAGLPSADREILAVLLGGQQDPGWNTYTFRGSYGMYEHFAPRFALSGPLSRVILPIVCATGRCRVSAAGDEDPSPLAWDGGPPWEFWLETRASGKDDLIEGSLRRGEETRPFSAASLLTAGGLVFFPGEVAVFDDGDAFPWVATLRRTGALRVPGKDRERLIRELFAFPRAPHGAPQGFAGRGSPCRAPAAAARRARLEGLGLATASLRAVVRLWRQSGIPGRAGLGSSPGGGVPRPLEEQGGGGGGLPPAAPTGRPPGPSRSG